MAARPASPARAQPDLSDSAEPSDFVRATDDAARRYLAALLRERGAPVGGVSADLAAEAQRTIGNGATAELLDPAPEDAAPETIDTRDDGAPDEVDAEEDEEELLPDPEDPAPADPAEDPALEDEEPSAQDTPPPKEGAEVESAPPPSSDGGGAGPGGGGGVVVPSGGGAQAVVAAAQQTAQNMPGAPASGQGGERARPMRRRRRRPTRRQIAGPPPVPLVEPEFTVSPDPIEPATKAIEEIAARQLPAQEMPPVPASPGENTVPAPERRLSSSDLRLISLGVGAMDRAGLSHEGGTALPEEAEAGETRNRLLALRENLLNPDAPADAQSGEMAPPEDAARETPAPQQDGEETDAEDAAPEPFTVQPAPVPSTDMTLAEQEMFTAVLANLKAGGRDAAKTLLNRIKRQMPEYPGGVLAREDPAALDNLGKGLLPDLEERMNTQVEGVAEVIGTAGAVLDEAVSQRRAALEEEADSQTERIRADAEAELLTIEDTAQARLDDAAAAEAQAADARRRAGSVGAAPELGFRRTAEAVIGRIQAKVSEAIAGFEFEKTERHKRLDAAKARWISAIDLASLADQFDAERARGLEPGATHPPDISRADRRAISNAINAARDWKTRQTTFIDGEIRRMKGQVDATVALNIRDVQDAGAAAFRALRDWGNEQDGNVGEWWREKVADLDEWAENATDTANTWASVDSRLARMQMQRAAQAARHRIQQRIARDEEENAAYQELTEGQKRNFIARNVLNSNQLIRQLGAPLRQSLFEARRESVAQTVESELFALPRGQWPALNAAARAKNSSFDAEQRANKILAAGYDDNLGTEEDDIFSALSGLRTIERLAVTAAYNDMRGSDNALYNDLDGELSGDEWRRAQRLMSGEHGRAAAEAIHDAVYGPGTDEDQIYEALETLNQLPEPDRTKELKRADAEYRRRYGESLSSRLSEDLSGSEAGRALALAAGEMDEARAHEMNYALGSHDADAAAAVYERIRSEEMANARREGWTPAQYEAAVLRRNQALNDAFETQYADVANYNWGQGTALENAVVYQFAFDEGSRHRLQEFQAGDLIGVSAGRMQGERRSFYADDEAMGDVVTAQYQAAADLTELERGPEMRAGVRRRVAREVRRREDADDPMTAEEIENYRMARDREMNAAMAEAAFDRAGRSVDALDARLQDRYDISLDDMITNTMSDNVFGDGGDLSNARERIAIMRRDADDAGALPSRRLDWAYTRVRDGIAGAGTDLPELRDSMGGLTREEMLLLNDRWKSEHDGETLRDAIQSDTSGRDEDDLVDLYDHGAPTTVAQQVDQLRRKLNRDEESVGFLGAWASENHSTRSRERLAELEAMAERMRDPNLTPQQREDITASFTEQRGSVENAIQAQRDRVDSYADMVTTVLGYVVSAVVIIAAAALTVVSGGTLSPALGAAIALTGSIVGTVSGIAAKAAIKGGAYGMEELGTDIAVGLVDLAVTMATAGMFKGGALFRNAGAMVTGVMEEVKAISRQSLRVGMRAAASQTARGAAAGAARATAREGAEAGASGGLLAAGRAYAREQAIDAATAIPTTLTANLLNEDNWRHGNVAANVLRGTWEASLQNLRDGVIMGGAGNLANRGARRLIHPAPLTPQQTHARSLRHWRHDNPGASPAEYARYVESYAAANSDHADVVRAAQREARRSLLSEIPPRERGAVADVPIIHVNDLQFRTYNKGNFGDAFVHVQNGQAVIIIRDGAPASAVAAIGPDLRDIVAPGTRGRTVYPAESLPPRLRDRVEVDVVNDPAFGADEVRAVPQRDRDGNIVGVALQVGPNARAIDIQLHVGTLDAMRRYAGLAGRVRMFMNRIGRRLGMDIVDPAQLARWEASLEVAKLPAIIDERMTRLSEHGLDPRRRALVMEEIANLERQFLQEVARAEPGAAAEARGYVAAKAQGDADAATRPAEESETAPPDLTPAQRTTHLRDLIQRIRAEQTRLAELDQHLLDAQGKDHSTAQNGIREQRDSYAAAMRELKQHLPADLHPMIDYIDRPHPWPPTVAANHSALAAHPAFAAALAQLGKQDQNTITRVGAYQEIIAEFHRTRESIEAGQRRGEELIARLQAEYRDIGGDAFMGVDLHPDLPERAAPPGYQPEYAFEAKFRDRLGSELGGELMQAIIERIEMGQSARFDALAEQADIISAALGDKTLEKVFEQVLAHRQGYRAELSLASSIAEGIDNLPGSGEHTVIDFGDPIGANEADVISVDAEGNVFLWDSKYRGEGSAALHSETFSDSDRRENAAREALKILEDPDRTQGLSEQALIEARKNLEAGTFFAITSHTNDVFTFRHSPPIAVVNGVRQ
ncbi:hypothetical protein D6850_08390 [Roseovarius spongiae]|uniref:Uncharacterized protein n=1 Tax=Roseovarius spongiae TaxID=2320272 RepID=A0A3A8AW52_9RHOB|nr:hypothetical protein [Roseovarius spongiae]RKF14880.1 hypothetical protein D6850_08390 [Roseovarius spongiae]